MSALRRVTGVGLLAAVTLATATVAAEADPILVSRTPSGAAGNGFSWTPTFDGTGRWAVFTSTARNLAPGATNGKTQVFLRDTVTGVTRLVSRRLSQGNLDSAVYSPDVSVDGRYVVFDSAATNLALDDANATSDVFRWDRLTGAITLVSPRRTSTVATANGYSLGPRVSGDGRFVVFHSAASDLTSINPGANVPQVYVRDLVTRTTRMVSVSPTNRASEQGSWFADISADGRYVVFYSSASNLVPGHVNFNGDVYWRDLATGATRVVSLRSSGAASNAQSSRPVVSGNGCYVAFLSDAALVPEDTNGQPDVYVRNMCRPGVATVRVSRTSTGGQIAGSSGNPSISADGWRVAFSTAADGVVPGDANGEPDVFVRDRRIGLNTWISAGGGKSGGGGSSISGNGKRVGFASRTAFVAGDANFPQPDSYYTRLATASDALVPTVRYVGSNAVLSDASGIAMVVRNGVVVRPTAAGLVRLVAGQRLSVWDGAGNVRTVRR